VPVLGTSLISTSTSFETSLANDDQVAQQTNFKANVRGSVVEFGQTTGGKNTLE